MLRGQRENLRWEPLTDELIRDFFHKEYPYPFRGLAFYWCDKLAGVGGVAFENGVWVAFSDIGETVKVPDIVIWRCAKLVMREILSTMDGPVFAGVVPNSAKWATLLGFKPTEKEELFVWERD